MGYSYTLDMTRVRGNLKTAQTFLTDQTARLCHPYVPRKTGRLAACAAACSAAGGNGGFVLYNVSYARYVFYRHKNWLADMKRAQGASLIRQTAAIAGGS